MAKGTRVEVFEKLQSANKKLRASNRQLRKELKRMTQDMDLLQSIWQAEIKDVRDYRRDKRIELEESRVPSCPQCGNPTLEMKVAGKWILESCSSCPHFERRKSEE